MIYLFKNRTIYLLILTFIVSSFFLIFNISSNFFDSYLVNLTSISTRYLFIISSLIIEYIIYNAFMNSTLIMRYKNKNLYLNKQIVFEVVLSFILILLFNGIILITNVNSSKYIFDIIILMFNYIVIYITISLIVKLVDIFFNYHILSSIFFLFFLVSSDYIVEHFNFFFFNDNLFNFSSIYIINYFYKNNFIIFTCILLVDILIYIIINIAILRKDFLTKKNDYEE